jgi:outer membrane protein TolC
MAGRQIAIRIKVVGRLDRGTSGAFVAAMTFRTTLAVLLLAAGSALAQPASNAADDEAAYAKEIESLFVKGGLTSEQAAQRAPNASPAVVRAAAELAATAAQLESAKYAEVPRVAANLSYTRLSFIPPVNLGFGGMNFQIPFLQNQYVLQGQLAVPISDYFLRFPKLVESARLAEQSSRLNAQATGLNAAQDARLAYYEWVRARLGVVIARRQLAQVQATLSQERALADVQRVSRADLLRIESQAAATQQQLDVLTNVAVLREEQLRLLIGAPEGEQLQIGEDIRGDVPTPSVEQLDALVKQALAKRLEFKSINAGIEAKEAQKDTEKANMYPHLAAFANVDYDRPNQRVFPQEDKFKFTWAAGLQLTWTLNDLLQSKATQHRLTAEGNELRADRDNLVRATRIELLNAQQAVQVAILNLQTSQTALISAEEGYRVRKELLNAERATAVELVDAQTTLTQARVAALNARIDLRVALAQLAHALGNDVKPTK